MPHTRTAVSVPLTLIRYHAYQIDVLPVMRVTLTVLVDSNPTAERFAALSALEPANPFCTPQYAAYRRGRGDQELVLLELESSRIVSGCAAFLRVGKLHVTLDIPSRPSLRDHDRFWLGVQDFCRRAGVTLISVNSFASAPGPMPGLWRVTRSKQRREYVISLAEPPTTRAMRKGHAYEVKRGAKAGLSLRRTSDPAACEAHVRLMNASITRQLRLGKNVTAVEQITPFRQLLESGAGEMFQATLDGEVQASSMILRARAAGYNHTQGTSPRGMSCGAAHFLIYEIAKCLRHDGMQAFNIGGTDEFGGGLERFKTGFSANTRCVSLESAEFRAAGTLGTMLRACARILAQR